ncbi:MAG: sel1 repeat family protein [Bacteroidales bacterium]|jgi:TPR repeat protein|nr:sel1 repeat family protein [Bacteroidales bacterium]
MKNKYYIIVYILILCICNGLNAQNYLKKAKSGNVQAQMKLAEQYYTGIGELKDYKQALIWYEKAAKNGNVDAMYQVATMKESGQGCETNVREAFNSYLKAAERGNFLSQLKVANMFETGEGTTKSDARAYLWYRVCAEKDDIMACRKLGDYYLNGNIVGKDHNEARYWYEKALNIAELKAKKEVSIANYAQELIITLENIAKIYTADEGIAPNEAKANEYLKEAEEIKHFIEQKR